MFSRIGMALFLFAGLPAAAMADVGAGGDCAGGARISVYAFLQGRVIDGYSANPVVSDTPQSTRTKVNPIRRGR